MNNKLLALNIVIAVVDTIIAALAILALAFAAVHFDKWGISLLCIVPLLFFYSHSLIIEADIDSAEESGDKNDG